MNRSIMVLLLVASFSVAACKQEDEINNWLESYTAIIHDFDSNRSTVEDLERVLNDASEKGAIRVKFPTGEWNYYCNHCAKLPVKERLAEIEFATDEIYDISIKKWIDENNVKGVYVEIDSSQPAEKFFILERILRRHGVIYWVESVENRGCELILMRESNGIKMPN